MSKTFPIPEAAIRAHKCCLCNHFLSVAPIMTAGLEKELYKCGRCQKVKCQTYTRNRLFEDIAQHLAFPCSYPQCDKNIPWNRVTQHEVDCPHRTMRCPIYYRNCSDVVRVDQLLAHFKEKHSSNFRKIGSVWELNVGYDYVFLTEEDGQYFLVYILHLEGIFSVAVLAMGPGSHKKFHVKLSPSTGDSFSVYFDDLAVVRYDERSHCYKCIRKKCEETHHPFSERNKGDEVISTDFTSKLKRELIDSIKTPNGDLRYTITLEPNENETDDEQSDRLPEQQQQEEEEEGTAGSNSPSDINGEALKKAVTCPYCMTYMAAPIFTCQIGHTICNVCRPRLEKCPMCAAPFGEFRNYTLEEVVKDVKVPCQYDSKGCTFLGSTTKMYFHEQECSFSNLLRE